MRGTPFLFEGFVGGLNTIDSPYTVAPNETRDCLNVVSTERGAIKKRTGSMLLTSSPPAVELNTLTGVKVASGSYLIAAGGKNLYAINGEGGVTTIGEGFTEGARWSIVLAANGIKKTGGPVYMVNGIDPPQYWFGAGPLEKVKEWVGEEGATYYEDATSKRHVPNGSKMVFLGNRIWMIGMSDDQHAVRFSDLSVVGEGGEEADPTNWPKENVVRLDPGDGGPLTAVGIVGPYVLLFKERKVWVVHNLDTGENRRLSDTIGCVAQNSIVETTLGTFFLTSDQGVYLTEGSKLHEMSYNVKPTILGINYAKHQNASAAYFNNHYYLSFASGSSIQNNRTLDYDVQLKSWWLHDLAGNDWEVWEPVPNTTGMQLYTIPPKVSAGVVHTFVPGVFQDSGQNYAGNGLLGAWWISGWEPFAYYVFRHRIKAPFLKKRVRAIHFDGSGQIIPIVYRNFSQGGRQEPAVQGNTPMNKPTFPVNFKGSGQIFGNPNEAQVFGGEDFEGIEMLFGGAEAETGDARIYSPGVARVWSVGWGNNSKEPFEVDSFAYFIQFRKS